MSVALQVQTCLIGDTLVEGHIEPAHYRVGDIRHRYEHGEKLEDLFLEYKRYIREPLRIIIMRPGETRFGKCVTRDQYLAVPAAKKGNFVYASRSQRAISRLLNLPVPNGSHKSLGYTLFVTLTLEERGPETWARMNEWFNIYRTQVSRLFKGCKLLRVQESQSDGTPHIHCVVYVPEGILKVRHKTRHKTTYRIANRSLLMRLKKLWPHGFSDYQLLNDWKHGVRYLSKYLTKSLDPSDMKGFQTLFYSSMYKTRIFGMSFRLDATCITQTNHWLLVCIGVPSMRLSSIEIESMRFSDGLYYFTVRLRPDVQPAE